MSNNIKIANRVSVVSLIVNLILSAFKLIAGILAFSSAMISDAVHSASDCFSTIVVIIGVNLSGKKADKGHNYGHERLECVAAVILSAMLIATAFAIGKAGVEKIINISKGGEFKTPGALALIAAVVSIAVKEWMYWYTRGAAKKINSSAMMADAWHHRSDMLSSVGSLIGIGGAMLGVAVLDPIASLVIAVMILKAAYDIAVMAINQLVDKAADDLTVSRIRDLIRQSDGVKGIDDIKTRQYGSKVYVDIELSVDGELSLSQAHVIAHTVHDKIEKEIENVKHCMVHVNPYSDNAKSP